MKSIVARKVVFMNVHNAHRAASKGQWLHLLQLLFGTFDRGKSILHFAFRKYKKTKQEANTKESEGRRGRGCKAVEGGRYDRAQLDG